MAEILVRNGEVVLARQLAMATLACHRNDCPRHLGPGPVFAYWWSDDEGRDAPPAGCAAYCSIGCWQLDQTGPRASQPRKWAERRPAGHYTDLGEYKP